MPKELGPQLRLGQTLFNSGKFFEAHERWEDVWRELDGEDKVFVQGLIQVAAALHKLTVEPQAHEGALYLIDRALQKIEGYPRFKGEPARLLPFIEIRNRIVAERIDLSDLPKLQLL